MRGLFVKVEKYAVMVHRYGGALRRNFRNVEDVGCVEWGYAGCYLLGGGRLFAIGGEFLELAHAVTVLRGGDEVE